MLATVTAWAVESSPIKAIKPMVETAYQWANESRTIPVYYTELHVKQKKPSLLVYLSRRFERHQELPPGPAVARYLSPTPALFIVGTDSGEFFNALHRADCSESNGSPRMIACALVRFGYCGTSTDGVRPWRSLNRSCRYSDRATCRCSGPGASLPQ
jgi:hypothetical protein